jgi:hypothetical protein
VVRGLRVCLHTYLLPVPASDPMGHNIPPVSNKPPLAIALSLRSCCQPNTIAVGTLLSHSNINSHGTRRFKLASGTLRNFRPEQSSPILVPFLLSHHYHVLRAAATSTREQRASGLGRAKFCRRQNYCFCSRKRPVVANGINSFHWQNPSRFLSGILISQREAVTAEAALLYNCRSMKQRFPSYVQIP